MGETVVEVHVVQVRIEASGTPTDYDGARLAAIAGAFAGAAGVDNHLVTVSVAAGSVVLDVAVHVDGVLEAAATQALLAERLGSASDATAFLSAASVSVINIPDVVVSQALVVVAPPPPEPPLPLVRPSSPSLASTPSQGALSAEGTNDLPVRNLPLLIGIVGIGAATSIAAFVVCICAGRCRRARTGTSTPHPAFTSTEPVIVELVTPAKEPSTVVDI